MTTIPIETMAIIGTGISGLGCAHFLQHRYPLTRYEKCDYAGGHANTLSIEDEHRSLSIDTGFMTDDEAIYPNLSRLFRELGVPRARAPCRSACNTCPASSNFAVRA